MQNRKVYTFLKDVGGVLQEEAAAVMDIIIPRICAVCGRTLTSGEKYLCIYCEADMPLTYYWRQRKNPMADKVNALIQANFEKALSESPTGGDNARTPKYSFAAALFFYHGESQYKKIPQRLKYLGDIDIGRFYAEMLGEFLRGADTFSDIDAVIPVPLHWARQWKRGYNQAEVIAKAVAEVFGIPVRTDILLREKSTKTQTKLGVEAKRINVSNAFTLSKKANSEIKAGIRYGSLYGKSRKNTGHILIVDDVFTTGATLSACINVLQPYFGSSIRISCATLGFVNSG